MPSQPALPTSLDSPDVRIVSTRLAREQDLLIEIESTRATVACQYCGRTIGQLDGYEEPRKLDYLPACGQVVAIVVRLKRFRCPNCADHPTTIQQLDWPAAGFEAS
jgi:predicted RNA-binding Zn-ribbon protein involved in translation (DUF1610 family)